MAAPGAARPARGRQPHLRHRPHPSLSAPRPATRALLPPNRAGRALRFFSGGSFFLYLAHPRLLSLLPALPAGSAAGRWAAWLGVLGLCLGVCYLVYGLFIRRFEALFAGR